MTRRALRALGGSLLGALVLGASGCRTEAFCWDECGPAADGSGGGGPITGAAGAITLLDAGPDSDPILNPDTGVDGEGGEGTFDDSACDGLDNDRDGEIDEDVNFASALTCGTCDNSCLEQVHVVGPACEPPAALDGSEPGRCGYDRCATDYYDLDPLIAGCEYYCPWNPAGQNEADLGGAVGCGADDACDGEVDEDVATCDDVENCGACGRKCALPKATAACVSTASGTQACTTANTGCVIERCEDGWFDADGEPDNGCEYQCTPVDADGEPCADPSACPELCDGRDNDCDQLIDNVDPSLETDDPRVGQACSGDPRGACAAAEHQGLAKCIGGQLSCCDRNSNEVLATSPNVPETGLRNGVCDADTGRQVLHPGELDETCNGEDDDCNGIVDDALVDVGSACGESGTGVCNLGLWSCAEGVRICLGNIDPMAGDPCNGKDDDCDGVIDGTLPPDAEPVECTGDVDCEAGLLCLSTGTGLVCALPPSDWSGPCDVPPRLPAWVSGVSGCTPGESRCVGGTRQCIGATRPPIGTADTCGVDNDCDGDIDARTDLKNDVHNCGACGHDCTGGSVFSTWSCVEGACVFGGCLAGRIDCDAADGPGQCERACVKTSDTEQCNGFDDDCDCFADALDPDGPPAIPAPTQICGVSSTATEPACTTGVTVACTEGAWRCTFPAGYCTGGHPLYCAGMFDPCDGLDNNCSGIADEQFVRPLATSGVKGEPCTAGVGACQVTGTYRCDTTGADAGTRTECGATPASPNQEACNGVDDDCDGSVDEGYQSPGESPSFVRPAVVRVDTNRWMFAYEASRPNATTTSSGAGNGYFVAAPPGETLDATGACSVPNRMPWVNVTPWEVEQICDALGGRICDLDDWQDTCRVNQGTTVVNDCLFGYGPVTRCSSDAVYPPATGGPYCNLSPFDTSGSIAGNQDALLPTAALATAGGCGADWTSVTALGNTLDAYDITGNAREIVRCQRDRAVCAQGVTDDASAAATCAIDCCAGTSTVDTTAPSGYQRVCGSLGTLARQRRRLSGQRCSASDQCCNYDDRCSTVAGESGTCGGGYCRNLGQATTCRARGVSCDESAQCCGGDACVEGLCGGPTSLPHTVYPLLGGGFATAEAESATCDFEFFKVESSFKLFDTGFRCCFDSDPTR